KKTAQHTSFRYYLSRIVITFLMLSMSSLLSMGQLVTTGGMSPTALVENVLLGGGVIVTNVSFTGSSSAIARFNGTNTNIGLNDGIIITTGTAFGNASGPVGPNNLKDAGIDNGLPGTPL